MNDGGLCIFGEVLFDIFPDGKRVLGGAPFNVAWHLQAFGQAPYFISRVGVDAEADEVTKAMADWGMDTRGLQVDRQHATGKVSITFDNGEPSYDIVNPSAYDAIDAGQLDNMKCRLLYHGSLALRGATSFEAAEKLKSFKPETVFVDVNLRPPWWQRSQVLEMVRAADWVKLNTDELASLCDGDASEFVKANGLSGLVLTHGADGAECLTASGERFSVRPEASDQVVDTVGAGDAFASVMILGLNNAWPLDLTIERAQAFASKLVTRRGATISDPAFYLPFVNQWGLEV